MKAKRAKNIRKSRIKKWSTNNKVKNKLISKSNKKKASNAFRVKRRKITQQQKQVNL